MCHKACAQTVFCMCTNGILHVHCRIFEKLVRGGVNGVMTRLIKIIIPGGPTALKCLRLLWRRRTRFATPAARLALAVCLRRPHHRARPGRRKWVKEGCWLGAKVKVSANE